MEDRRVPEGPLMRGAHLGSGSFGTVYKVASLAKRPARGEAIDWIDRGDAVEAIAAEKVVPLYCALKGKKARGPLAAWRSQIKHVPSAFVEEVAAAAFATAMSDLSGLHMAPALLRADMYDPVTCTGSLVMECAVPLHKYNDTWRTRPGEAAAMFISMALNAVALAMAGIAHNDLYMRNVLVAPPPPPQRHAEPALFAPPVALQVVQVQWVSSASGKDPDEECRHVLGSFAKHPTWATPLISDFGEADCTNLLFCADRDRDRKTVRKRWHKDVPLFAKDSATFVTQVGGHYNEDGGHYNEDTLELFHAPFRDLFAALSVLTCPPSVAPELAFLTPWFQACLGWWIDDVVRRHVFVFRPVVLVQAHDCDGEDDGDNDGDNKRQMLCSCCNRPWSEVRAQLISSGADAAFSLGLSDQGSDDDPNGVPAPLRKPLCWADPYQQECQHFYNALRDFLSEVIFDHAFVPPHVALAEADFEKAAYETKQVVLDARPSRRSALMQRTISLLSTRTRHPATFDWSWLGEAKAVMPARVWLDAVPDWPPVCPKCACFNVSCNDRLEDLEPILPGRFLYWPRVCRTCSMMRCATPGCENKFEAGSKRLEDDGTWTLGLCSQCARSPCTRCGESKGGNLRFYNVLELATGVRHRALCLWCYKVVRKNKKGK